MYKKSFLRKRRSFLGSLFQFFSQDFLHSYLLLPPFVDGNTLSRPNFLFCFGWNRRTLSFINVKGICKRCEVSCLRRHDFGPFNYKRSPENRQCLTRLSCRILLEGFMSWFLQKQYISVWPRFKNIASFSFLSAGFSSPIFHWGCNFSKIHNVQPRIGYVNLDDVSLGRVTCATWLTMQCSTWQSPSLILLTEAAATVDE